ncbi:hypothetical protein RUESEDTHA_02282 [Ruegeria sp. THAF57]|uniref:hypothetical protein n=1 Tax=Ruegeria sp. THAF57 TaxID=2744555 RepID=UPI0015DEC29C|nr:hypothetical protein [Ruegeria sp. THAF57]CAD0185395.1 hypothetical protein RUESEDTHA_02282 [Ruegeria sp. THAF57]
MTGSKFLLVASVVGTVFLAACSAPGTYPITGDQVSASDPVRDMESPTYIYRGEAR